MRSGDAAKVGTAALFGNDTRRGQRRKVDDTHVRHFFGEVEEGRRPFTHPEVMLLAETLFEICSGKLLTTLAATKIPVFQRLWELAAYQDASGLFCVQVVPGVQLARESRRSENIESCRTLASEGL